MASRSKKDASDALAQLERYISRDKRSSPLIEAVRRYQGELRQTITALKSDVESLHSGLASAAGSRDGLSEALGSAKSKLLQEEARHRQTQRDLAIAEAEVRRLSEELEPDDIPTFPADLSKDLGGFFALFKTLRRRVRRVPKPTNVIAIKGEKAVGIFEVGDFIQDYQHGDYITLGMFATVSALVGTPVCFTSKDNPVRKLEDKRKFAIIRWMRSWIAKEAKWKDKIFRSTDPDTTVRPGTFRYGGEQNG